MKLAREQISGKSDHLATHPFFARLTPENDLRRALRFGPPATFWVMSFQDVIRLNAERTEDPAIRRLVEQHLKEDTGHEQWFLDDLKAAFGEEPGSIRWLFSEENLRVREVAYSLMAEVFRARDDRLRLLLLEVLEAGAAIYFGFLSRFLAASGHAGKVKYFAGVHLEAEAGHEMHGEEQKDRLDAIALPPELRDEADALIDRMYAAFWLLGDALLEQIERKTP